MHELENVILNTDNSGLLWIECQSDVIFSPKLLEKAQE